MPKSPDKSGRRKSSLGKYPYGPKVPVVLAKIFGPPPFSETKIRNFMQNSSLFLRPSTTREIPRIGSLSKTRLTYDRSDCGNVGSSPK